MPASRTVAPGEPTPGATTTIAETPRPKKQNKKQKSKQKTKETIVL
jgi:hypothetical protein